MSAGDLLREVMPLQTVRDDDGKLIVPAPTNPMAVARRFLDDHYPNDVVGSLIRHHRNTFHVYDGTAWPELEDRRLQADLYNWLADALYWKRTAKGEELVEWEPTKYKVGDVVEALRARTHLDQVVQAPAWLVGDDDDPDVVPVSNGLLRIAGRKLQPHTPAFFSPHVLPFEFDPTAPAPARWLRFLEELWPADDESARALAEIMGYILGGATSLQKIFMVVGPLRSGKGTIGRVLTGLLGAHNVAAPTLAGMTTNFGLSPLIGRPLGLISDARLGNRADGTIAVERLLSISGEDSITIDRKYRDPWTGRLPTRFMILTNEIPRFTDASGALASRFLILVMTTSFYGREDPTLTDQLLAEAPGIFNWCLDGLDRLNARGYFEQPLSARAALQRLEDLAAPVSAFVRDRCVVAPLREVGTDVLFEEWKRWCLSEGKDRAGTKSVFLRDLHAAYPGLKATRPREGGSRVHKIEGIGLRTPDDPDDADLDKQWTGPLTTPDHPNVGGDVVRGAVLDGGVQTRRSEHVVRGGQGSPALYVQDRFGPGDVVRHQDHRGLRLRVKAVTDGVVDCWEIEAGLVGKRRAFPAGELILVEKGRDA